MKKGCLFLSAIIIFFFFFLNKAEAGSCFCAPTELGKKLYGTGTRCYNTVKDGTDKISKESECRTYEEKIPQMMEYMYSCSFETVPDCSLTTKQEYIYETTKPTLQINIPTLPKFSEAKIVGEKGNRYVIIPWLSEYIGAVYKYLVGIAGIAAVIMIMVGGFLWISAGGSADRVTKGKEFINNALVGLVLILSSYFLLYLINPNLVSFEAMKIKVIEPVPFLPEEMEKGDEFDNACIDTKQLVSLNNIDNVKYINKPSSDRLGKEAQKKLATAGKTAKNKGYGLIIISSYRDTAYQQKLFEEGVLKAMKEHGTGDRTTAENIAKKTVAAPSCKGPHTTGNTIDVHLTKDGKELKGENMGDMEINLLEDIMRSAGWTRYCSEWWHFECCGTGRWKSHGGEGVKNCLCPRPYSAKVKNTVDVCQ